jgi:benzodiazapine receptor
MALRRRDRFAGIESGPAPLVQRLANCGRCARSFQTPRDFAMQTFSMSRSQAYKGMAGWFLVTFIAAAIGAWASMDAPAFYGELQKPAWAPPSSVFGPVWTVLYVLMAYSAWLVWVRSGGDAAYIALTLFLVQLALNALWSWLFFAWHMGGMAFVDVMLLWIALAATIIAFSRHSWIAAALLLPYWLWTTYAAALNYSVWKMNGVVM